ncbi:hypothetical protein JCM19233_3504 [Vibrio astriarenae]|nr:hypothetical protein JCM19233_3504 [Vibrio sp. C7]
MINIAINHLIHRKKLALHNVQSQSLLWEATFEIESGTSLADKHPIKTMELLLTLCDVIPKHTSRPLGYQALADTVTSRGTSASYHSVRRILKNTRLQELLGIEVLTVGTFHAVRYRANYLEGFPHAALVAYLSSNMLLHYLPDKVRSRFLEVISPYLDQFEKLHDGNRDKRWIKKLPVDKRSAPHWSKLAMTPELDSILGALYNEQWLEITYQTETDSTPLTEVIWPIHLNLDEPEGVKLCYSRNQTQKATSSLPLALISHAKRQYYS